MEIFWFVVSAGIVWFLLSFRTTKARVRQSACLEFAQFIVALDAWNIDRADFESHSRAMQHFIVYDQRRADFAGDPSGLSISAGRALLAGYWIEFLKNSRLLDNDGHQSLWHPEAINFWASIDTEK